MELAITKIGYQIYCCRNDIPFVNRQRIPRNEHLSLLVGRYILTKVIVMNNKDKSCNDDQCASAFDLKQEAHIRWTVIILEHNWEEFFPLLTDT